MSDDIYDGVDGEDVANLYDELYTFITDYANAQSTEQAKFKKKYPKKYGTIRRLLVNEIHSSNKAEGGIVGLFNNGEGFFVPDDVLNISNIMTILQDKKFPPELIDALGQVQAQLTGTRLRK